MNEYKFLMGNNFESHDLIGDIRKSLMSYGHTKKSADEWLGLMAIMGWNSFSEDELPVMMLNSIGDISRYRNFGADCFRLDQGDTNFAFFVNRIR